MVVRCAARPGLKGRLSFNAHVLGREAWAPPADPEVAKSPGAGWEAWQLVASIAADSPLRESYIGPNGSGLSAAPRPHSCFGLSLRPALLASHITHFSRMNC